MNILQISPQVPLPTADGGKISKWGIAKYLSLRGHQIHFVAYRKNTVVGEIIDEFQKYTIPHILEVQTENSFYGAVLNLFSPIPYNVSKFIRKELTDFVHSFLNQNEIDIVLVNNLHMGWIVDEIKKIKDIPVVLRQENVEMIIMKRFYQNQKNLFIRWYAYLQYKKLIKYEPEVCRKFDNCIMVSDIDEMLLKQLDPKVTTSSIPVGVESSLLSFKKEKIIPYSIAHLGQMSWLPNFDGLQWYIIEVFPKIVREIPESCLFVYGGGSFSKLKIPATVINNVKIVGYVEDIWKELNDKSLVVIPLRIGSGIRVKILEMLAAGQPVLTTSVGKEGIPVTDGVHLHVADSELEMLTKTINFFQNKYDNEKISISGRKIIRENYTWEIVAEKFEKVFNTLISQSKEKR